MRQTPSSFLLAASSCLLVGGYTCCVIEAFELPAARHRPTITRHNIVPSIPTIISFATIAQDDFNLDKLENDVTELSRRDRRDFYDHNAWVRHRGSQRFFDNLFAVPFSKVVWMVAAEVLVVSAIATSVVLWNHGLVIGYEDVTGAYHAPLLANTNLHVPLLTLPAAPFVLSSPALSLLLVFRTNTCWGRWDEARKAWGVIVNHSRTIARKTSSWIMESDLPYEEKQRLLTRIADAVWAFPRAERRHLLSEFEDEADFVTDVQQNLQEPFASDLIKNKRHRPSFALFEMTCAINELPVDVFRRNRIDESVSELCNAMGACDRLYSSPIPKFYNRHSSRFLSLWLALMPLTLWSNLGSSWNHIYLIIVSSMIALGMLGVEQIALMIEEPFSILPLKQIADGIGKSASEHVEFNIIEEFGISEKTTDQPLLRKYMSENYNIPEYLEALSTETTIRNRDLAKPTGYVPGPVATRTEEPSAQPATPETPPTSYPQQQYSSAQAPPQEQQLPPMHLQGTESASTGSSNWDYLAQATAAMDEKLEDYDRIAGMQLETLRDIEKDLKLFGTEESP